MKHTLLAALAVLVGLVSATAASAGGYGEGYYSGAELYVARADAPIYDCAGPGCRTDIRLRSGSWIYAYCWDGGEGWCRVRTRYFKNMFVPRYALDLGNGGGHKSYYYKEGYGRKSYNDCLYRERYSYKGSYREGCYEKETYKDYGSGYKRPKYGAYSYEKDYGYSEKSYGYSRKRYSYKPANRKEYYPEELGYETEEQEY